MACSVYQYFGERFTPNGLEIYYTEPDNISYDDFDCSILSQSIGLNFTKFKLTELELLASSDINTWLSFCAVQSERDGQTELLGIKMMQQLIGDFATFVEDAAIAFDNIMESRFQSVVEHFQGEEDTEVWAKFEIGLDWLKTLHSDYYGKTYLVQVGDSNVGVCIKDRFGNVPAGNVKVESEGGIYYSSDAPSPAGGWLAKNQNQVMGLSVGPELYPFTENDNRISSFVQFNKATEIDRFNLTWDIDLSQHSKDSFYTKGNDLYVQAEIDPAIYKIGNKQYALITLSSPGVLRLNPNGLCSNILASAGAQSILLLHGDSYKDTLTATACDDPDDTGNGTTPDFTNINVFKFESPAICPENFCLPFKSNVFTYGPWFFQADPVGGTEVEANRELAPWNFSNLQNNGYDVMNSFGQMIAADGPRGLQKMESGSITVASLPSYSIGYVVGGNAGTLTDIQINIGDNGYTTTYNFQTYTPKFGKPGRHLSDLWSRNYKSMSYMYKFFKEENLKIRGLFNQASQKLQDLKYKQKLNRNTSNNPVTEAAGTHGQKTPHMMLYTAYRFRKPKQTNDDGGIDDFDNSPGSDGDCSCKSVPTPAPGISPSQGTSGNSVKNLPIAVTETSLHDTWFQQNHFHRLALNTLDLFFCPMSTNQEDDPDAELPRLAMYQTYDGSFVEFSSKTKTALGDGKAPNSRTRTEIPPFYFDDILQYDLPINQMYLNSVTSVGMLSDWDARTNSTTQGFITNIIGYGSAAQEFSLSALEDAEDQKQQATNFRYSVLRGPLSLQAWGYDTAGKPIPNAVDSALQAEKGKFRRRGLQDKFLKDWLSNPKTWPAGPIDLRWDRERGVWVAPPANKIVVARLLTNLEKFGVAEAELVDPQAGGVRFYEEYDVWSGEGANIKQSMNKAKIKVYDFLGVKLCKCDYIYAYYDDNRYIVLESNRAYKDPNELCCATSTTASTPSQPTPSQPTPTSCWCNLECLKTLKNYQEGKHQALVHKSETQGPDCLMWEDIVECYTTPPNFYANDP